MMYHRQKSDLNQAGIVTELRQIGCSVLVVSHLLKFDIIVGWKGRSYLFEIKGIGKPLRPSQKVFHDLWNGQIDRIECTEDAIEIMEE